MILWKNFTIVWKRLVLIISIVLPGVQGMITGKSLTTLKATHLYSGNKLSEISDNQIKTQPAYQPFQLTFPPSHLSF
jgi:hypothetical protein